MKAAILIVALAAAASTAGAATITSTLYDTGVNGSGTPSASLDVVDSHFTVTAEPAGTGTPPFEAITTYVGGFYYKNGTPIGTTTADWITTAYGTGPTLDSAVGLYNYEETVITSGAGTFTFTGDWATDNCGTITVNNGSSPITGTGTTIGGGAVTGCSTTNTSYFSTPTAFSFTVNLNSGANSLDFNVWNSAVSPTALFVDHLATGAAASSTPEPSSTLYVLTGLPLLGAAIVRSRRAGNRA
jgi:hypothetical protein